jgi:hypothetical protein
MFEHHESNDIRIATYSINDTDIPEQPESWSLKDFEDILPRDFV